MRAQKYACLKDRASSLRRCPSTLQRRGAMHKAELLRWELPRSAPIAHVLEKDHIKTCEETKPTSFREQLCSARRRRFQDAMRNVRGAATGGGPSRKNR